MGLDAWLMAKTKARAATDENSATGVCSGIFGIVPTAVSDAVELCYLRKGYDQQQLICETVGEETDENYTIHFREEDVDRLLEKARRILETHDFDEEDGNDITEDDREFSSECFTWMSESKWKDLIKGLEEAKSVLEEDQEADIYYHEWF